MKEQSMLQILSQDGKLAQENKIAEELTSKKIDLAELSEQQKAKHLSGFNPMTSNGNSIISATAGNITNTGGPSKYVKSESSNSIFDPNKLEAESKKIDNKTATQMEKQKIESVRDQMRAERTESIITSLEETDTRKAKGVNSMAEYSGSGYKAPINNMSIFDSTEFGRVPEKTAGEILSDGVQKRREQVDNSWKTDGKAVSSKDVTKRLFDGLFTKPGE